MVHQAWNKWKPQLLSLLKALFFICCLIPSKSFSQTSKTGQFWSKYKFSHPFGNKWASEMEFTARYSETPEKKSIFATRSQFSIQGWAHYHYSSRWRFSGQVAYFDNPYLPDIDQENSKEWRLALQGMYFFHKIGYTFRTRGRAEFRFLSADDSDYKYTFRYRQRIKYQKPINSKSFRKGVFYILAADEIYFKVNSVEGQNTFFDRNVITVGGGYVLTDNLQLELAYVNQFLLRSDVNEIINAISFTLTYNNLFGKIREKLKKKGSQD